MIKAGPITGRAVSMMIAMTCDPYNAIDTPFTHHHVSKERVTFINFKRTQTKPFVVVLTHFFTVIQKNFGTHLVGIFLFSPKMPVKCDELVSCTVATRPAIHRLAVRWPPMFTSCARPLMSRMFTETRYHGLLTSSNVLAPSCGSGVEFLIVV